MDTMSLPTLQTPACTPSCTCARVWSLVGMYTLSAAIGAVAGGGLAAFNGWGAESDPVRAAGLAGAAVLATSLLVLGAFRAMNFGKIATKAAPNPTVQPTILTAMSATRMMLSLVVGLGLYLVLKPEGKTFWVAFLLGGLLSLLVETAWSIRWLRASAASSPSAASGPEVGS